MIDPEEIPTAEAVAAAVVAAARVTGEDPLSLADPVGPRARFPALAALAVFYPECPPPMLGRCVGLNSNVRGRLDQAKNAKWWPEAGAAAVEAAVGALEALA